jgi:hypothetical protein
MSDENENADSKNGEQDYIVIDPPEDNDDVSALTEKYNKLAEKNKQLFARAKKAEGFNLGDDGKWVKKTPESKPAPVEPPKKPEAQQANLDETQLDYLDLKGITDPDEIDVIQKVIAKTGQTVRQALKDDYVTSKLSAIRQDKEVKNATPGASRRGGDQTSDLASAVAKFDQTGELPNDFELRSKVINAKVDRENTNKPFWHK